MDQTPDYSLPVAEFVLFSFKGIIGTPTHVCKAIEVEFVSINYDDLTNKKQFAFIPMKAYLHWQSVFYEKQRMELDESAIF